VVDVLSFSPKFRFLKRTACKGSRVGYYIKFLKTKKSSPNWKVQFVSYKNSDIENSKAKKPKREWDIPKNRWRALGFTDRLTILEARVRAKQLNSQIHLRKQEEHIRKTRERRAQSLLRYESFLPSEFVAEFEQRFIRKRDSQTENGLRRTTRAFVSWRAAQRLIVAMESEPTEWLYHAIDAYEFMHQQKWSVRYSSSVLKIANLWGFFISKKMGHLFYPIPHPKGYERQRIIEASYEKTAGVSRPSLPLTPASLESKKEILNKHNYDWLYLSVWFGLRPKEVDSLKMQEMWRLEVLGNGRKILWVFQTKIIALPPEDRWKPIPIIFPEQELALKIIELKKFKRPLLATMKRHFGKGYILYAGRKGFSDLMLSRGQNFENISVWMGHSTLQRTWKSYKNRKKFHLGGY
jgi:hypothetical protein